MLVLGISDDAFDSGVTLVDGGTILFAANEERYTGNKTQGGFPFESLDGLLRYTQIDPRDIQHVCVSGIMTPPLAKRLAPGLQRLVDRHKVSEGHDGQGLGSLVADYLKYETPITQTRPGSLLPRLIGPSVPTLIRRLLPRGLRHAPIHVVEHHRAHAASAYNLSGFDDALCITGDGMGDGLSFSVSRATPTGIERLWTSPARASFGLFFETITEALGFIPCRHEGKITGMAALGDPSQVDHPSPFRVEDGALIYTGLRGRHGVQWARDNLVARYTPQDIAAWAQQQIETHVVAIVERWLAQTGLRAVCAAGGIFANVRLNQHLHELPHCEALFVCPNMGDGGLSLGAIAHAGHLERQRLSDAFLGEDYSAARIEAELKRVGLRYEALDDIEQHVAAALASGKLVARYAGRMEWGPRALGNRSVLSATTDPAYAARLNDKLRRDDFMPFAPVVMEEDMDRYALDWRCAAHAAEFMTTTFGCTPHMREAHPAVVHSDGTARTQLVPKGANPGLHAVLAAYKQRTGHGILLNTSFNIHESPIVSTPEDAVRAFTDAKLDYLAAGPFFVRGRHVADSATQVAESRDSNPRRDREAGRA